MAYCPNCGNTVPSNSKSCTSCGNKLIKRPVMITILSIFFIVWGTGDLITKFLFLDFLPYSEITVAFQIILISIGIALLSGKKLGRLVAIGLIVLSIGAHGYYLIENLDYAQIITIVIGGVLLFYLWRPHVVLYYNSKEIMR